MLEIKDLLKLISLPQVQLRPVQHQQQQQQQALRQVPLRRQLREEGRRIKVERKRNRCYWTWNCRHHVDSGEVEPEVGPEVKILDHASIHVTMKILVKFSPLPLVQLKLSKRIQMAVTDKQEQIFSIVGDFFTKPGRVYPVFPIEFFFKNFFFFVISRSINVTLNSYTKMNSTRLEQSANLLRNIMQTLHEIDSRCLVLPRW